MGWGPTSASSLGSPDPLDLPARPGRGLRSAATAPGRAPPHYSPWAGRSECRDGRRRSRRSWRRRPGPAPLHFNRQRPRSARSGRPGGVPRASRTRPAPGGERAPGGPAGWGGRLVRALAHLAHRTHRCAGPARAWLPGRRSDPGIDPARPLQAGHYIPHPGRAPEGRPYPGGAGGGGARRCGPGRLDKSAARCRSGPRAVAGGGPAMSLVLLSLAALCCGAVPPEPVSTPVCSPLPRSGPSNPDPNASQPISSCSSEAFAEGRLKPGSGVGLLKSGARESDGFGCHHAFLIQPSMLNKPRVLICLTEGSYPSLTRI